MATRLITFLGRVPKNETGYRKTHYDFGDGRKYPPSAFFGWTLLEHRRPDAMVILGTTGSMWDHLFEQDLTFGAQFEEERMALLEAVERNSVTSDLLEPLEPALSEYLGLPVHLQLIPYCHTPAEQVDLLRILAEHVASGDSVDLDVTHGFRHLPMLGLLSALHLRRVRDARIRHIWYGAFNQDTGEAPVHDLSGLLEIADWVEAIAVYDHDGDYGVFSPLLKGELGEHLAEADFLESVNRIGNARSHLRKVLQGIDDSQETAAAPFALFREELKSRLVWAEGQRFYERQRNLAHQYLKHGRYSEAILTGHEAFVTRLLQERDRSLDPDNYEHRLRVSEAFEDRERQQNPRSELYRAYDRLRRLRNTVAHGSHPKGAEVQRALSGHKAMHDFLATIFATLLPE
ncbi:MAG: TIGR02221 family CRISPR-associated protein [Methylohalobius crimeensis]